MDHKLVGKEANFFREQLIERIKKQMKKNKKVDIEDPDLVKEKLDHLVDLIIAPVLEWLSGSQEDKSCLWWFSHENPSH